MQAIWGDIFCHEMLIFLSIQLMDILETLP